MSRPRRARGAAESTPRKYPRIINYLEDHHPKVYQVINALAMHGCLVPRKGGAITFLLPDEKLLGRLVKLSTSDKPEEATDIISSLVLDDLYLTPEDFKGEVVNLLGRKVIVKKVTDKKVEIEKGELTPDKNFHPFERQGNIKRGNMAVWHLKGEVDFQNAPEAPVRRGKRRPLSPESVSGGDENATQVENLRLDIVKKKMETLLHPPEGKKMCPLFNAVVRLLRVFHEDYPREYLCARGIITHCAHVDFYYLFYNPLIFPYRVVWEAYQKGLDTDQNVDFLRNFCAEKIADQEALVLQPDGLAKLNTLRDQVRMDLNIDRFLAGKVLKLYENVDRTNTLAGVGPVYPAVLAEIFSQQPGLHLALDEFALFAYRAHREMCAASDPKEKARLFLEFTNNFRALYGDFTNPAAKTTLDKPETYGALIDPQGALYQTVTEFLRTFTLHFPCLSDGKMERVHGSSPEAEDPYAPDLIDVDEIIVEDLGQQDNSPLQLSPETVAELRAYARIHEGKLPPLEDLLL